MDLIYLSPHFDDVALSLGGLIFEQTRSGQNVTILTICAGDPPSGDFSPFAESLHVRWGIGREAIRERRAEDIESCRRLGASYHHLKIPDCIYRRSSRTKEHLYNSESALWIPVHPDEALLIDDISSKIREIQPFKGALICPLTLGNHVDHRLTRAAAERVDVPLQYYADYPYVVKADLSSIATDLKPMKYTITPDGMLAWQDAVAAHRSQISTFWKDLDEMGSAIQMFYQQMGGIWLWQ
jgi:LmbE family N-acetylglucosaminyl deacetylase